MTIRCIVLDPGHGGSQRNGGSSPNNATGPNGLLEKNLTLDVARLVRDALVADPGPSAVRVLLTRDGDTNPSLADRARVAHDNNADIFVSIHLNGDASPSTDGSET